MHTQYMVKIQTTFSSAFNVMSGKAYYIKSKLGSCLFKNCAKQWNLLQHFSFHWSFKILFRGKKKKFDVPVSIGLWNECKWIKTAQLKACTSSCNLDNYTVINCLTSLCFIVAEEVFVEINLRNWGKKKKKKNQANVTSVAKHVKEKWAYL